MSLKDNFNQAVKEILRKDGLVGEDLSKESRKKSDLDRYLDPPGKGVISDNGMPMQPSADAAQAAAGADNPEQTPFSQLAQIARQNAAQNGATRSGGDPFASAGASPYNSSAVPPPKPPVAPPSYSGREPDKNPYNETEETTVISRNTIVDGNIRSFANVSVDGSVKGDVKITKNINVTGKIIGDVECNNSIMSGASMQGNIASKGQVQIDRDSLLLGDIAAQYLDLNGKVKGNVQIGGKAEFKTDSIILGNITASTITVLDGATIQGYVNTTFLQDSSSSLFPEAISVSE